MKYRFKYRSRKYDKIADGWYLYSKKIYPFKTGRYGGKKKRISGPFKTKTEARAMAGIMALKMKEVEGRVKRYPTKCVKTKGRATQKAICVRCRRTCSYI